MQRALAEQGTAKALASLRDLEGFVTVPLLERPRASLVAFAEKYRRTFVAGSLDMLPERFPGPTMERLAAVRRVVVGYDDRVPDPTLHRVAALLRLGIDLLRDDAESAVLRLSTGQRRRFLTGTSWSDVEDSDLDARGFGAWPTGEPAYLPADPGEVRNVALTGDAEAVYDCLTVAGTEALAWPWLLRLVTEWRAALEAGDTEARDKLKRIGNALAAITGKGPTPNLKTRERNREIGRLRTELIAVLRRLKANPKAEVPQELLGALNAHGQDGAPAIDAARIRQLARRRSLALAADELLGALFRLDADTVKRVISR